MGHNGVSTAVPPARLRVASTHAETADRLGALKDLPGFWQGVGFSLIARPDHSARSGNGIFLQLNLVRETLELTPIGSPVVNRGSVDDDVSLYGVTYLHRLVDEGTGGALHIEPGLWLNDPAVEPGSPGGIARLATIPHGNAVCTTGFSMVAELGSDGLPSIPPANTTPYPAGGAPPAPGSPNPFEEYDLSVPSEHRTAPLPAGITQAVVTDPNQLLRDALAHEVIDQGGALRSSVRLITSSDGDGGGVVNIPFITRNADAPAVESVFAIDTVVDARGTAYLQLQYSQTVPLIFNGMTFPHVTVGTLVKAF